MYVRTYVCLRTTHPRSHYRAPDVGSARSQFAKPELEAGTVGAVVAVEELDAGTVGVIAAVEQLKAEKMVGVVAAIKGAPTLVAVKEEETAKEVLATLRSSAIFLFSERRYGTVGRTLHVLVRMRTHDFANHTHTGFANC